MPGVDFHKPAVAPAVNHVSDNGRFVDGLPAKDDMAAAKEDMAAAKENTAAAKEDTAAAKEDTAATKEDTAAAKEDAAAAKKDIVAAKEDMTVVKDDAAAVKDDMAAIKEDMAVVKDDTAAAKDDTPPAKDDTPPSKDDTPPAKDDMATIKQEKLSTTEENAMVVVKPDDPTVKKPIVDTNPVSIKPLIEEWKVPDEQVAEDKPKAALKSPKIQPISTKQQAAGVKNKGKPGAKVSTTVEQIVCQEYVFYSRQQHLPLSGGPLNLPFQRPPAKCRKFESPAIEEVIKELGNKILDLDLAQMFRNCLPNTLGEWFGRFGVKDNCTVFSMLTDVLVYASSASLPTRYHYRLV